MAVTTTLRLLLASSCSSIHCTCPLICMVRVFSFTHSFMDDLFEGVQYSSSVGRIDTSGMQLIIPTASFRDRNIQPYRIQPSQIMGCAVPLRSSISSRTNICTNVSLKSPTKRTFHASSRRDKPILEPRLEDHGHVIHDKYSTIRDSYGSFFSITPLSMIVLLTSNV